MTRVEYYMTGLEPQELDELTELASRTLGEPGQMETDPVDALGNLQIWQKIVNNPPGEPLIECLSLSRVGMVHGNDIDSDSPLGQLLERLQQVHSGQE